MKRRIIAALAAISVVTPVVATVDVQPAAAITYNVQCYTNPYYPPIKSGSGTTLTSASLQCFRNIANAVWGSSCVQGVGVTGNNPTRAGRVGYISKGEADQGWPWYCGNQTDVRTVTSFIP